MPLSWRKVIVLSSLSLGILITATAIRAATYHLTGGGSATTGKQEPTAFPIDWELGLDSTAHTLNLEITMLLPPIPGTWKETGALTFKANARQGYEDFLTTVNPDSKPKVKSFKFPKVFILGTTLGGEVKAKSSAKSNGKRLTTNVSGFFSGELNP